MTLLPIFFQLKTLKGTNSSEAPNSEEPVLAEDQGVARFLFIGEFVEDDGEVWLSIDLLQGYNRSRGLICLADAKHIVAD